VSATGTRAQAAPHAAPGGGSRPARRVLHVITGIERGGAENHLAELAFGQVAAGWEVAVAYLKGDPYWGAALAERGVAVEPLGLRFYGDPVALARLRRLVRRFRPDVVHAHLQPAEVYARLALPGRGGPRFVISKHNNGRFFDGNAALALAAARWVGRRADAIIGISEAVRTRVVNEALAREPGRVRTVHYGVDAEPYRAPDPEGVRRLREAWGAREGTVLFGTAARMVPVKSLETLLEGFALLRRRRPDADTRLVLVGAGPLQPSLRERAGALGIGDACVWAGFREDMPRVMGALDVFALTSLSEGFGLVLIEAMAAGKPVLSTRVGATPEIVVPGRTGHLVPPREPGELARAMEACLDPAVRGAYGSAGRERSLGFTLDRMVAATLRVYEGVLA
jgi:glycosyltransferase involved in cell wall biosynthesis